MADDKKPDIQEDWDKLPLDPDAADDWDDIPPPPVEKKAPAASTSSALEKVSPAEDYFEAQTQSGPSKSSDRYDKSPMETEAPKSPPAMDTAAGEAVDSLAEDDFELPDDLPDDEALKAALENTVSPVAGPAEPADALPPAEEGFEVSAPETEAPVDDIAGSNEVTEITIDEVNAEEPAEPAAEAEDDPDFAPARPAADGQADDEEIPLPNASEPPLPTQKVELDIEGMQFQEDKAPPEQPEEADPFAAATEDEAPREASMAGEPEAGQRRKIPRLKLLLILIPAILLFGGLVFGLMALFSDPEPEYTPPPPPTFSPEPPPREAVMGEMRLESFYISFPGRSNDTIIELSLVLHYNDSPSARLIRNHMSNLRDIIYRVTQGKGSLVITDSELQRVLREELRERLNLLLGGEYISYVQIDQIRILQ